MNPTGNRLREWVRNSGPALYRSIQDTVILIGLLAVIALQLPWLQDLPKRIGVTDQVSVVLAIFAVVLVALYYEVKNISSRLSGEKRHFTDPVDVYPMLLQQAQTIRRPEEKVLDVLGMSLYTAWPTIRFWLARPEMSGWKVRLAATVNKDDDHLGVALVPDTWFSESATNLDDIVASAGRPAMKQHNIQLEAYGYDFVPAVHGFRLGNGDLFYSVLHWQEDGRIGRDTYSYEYISCEDHSPTAQATRALFDSWFERARKFPWS